MIEVVRATGLVKDGRLQVRIDLKGDLPGHPFRGNQWTGSGGGGSWKESTKGLPNEDAILSSVSAVLSEFPGLEKDLGGIEVLDKMKVLGRHGEKEGVIQIGRGVAENDPGLSEEYRQSTEGIEWEDWDGSMKVDPSFHPKNQTGSLLDVVLSHEMGHIAFEQMENDSEFKNFCEKYKPSAEQDGGYATGNYKMSGPSEGSSEPVGTWPHKEAVPEAFIQFMLNDPSTWSDYAKALYPIVKRVCK